MAINDQVTIPSGTGSASQWLSGSDVPDNTGATPTGTAPAGSLYFRHDPASGAPGVGPAVYEKAPAYTPTGATQAIPAGWRPLAGGEVINVKRFGARGDGTVDDSPAFNAAFAAARAASSYPAGSPPVYAPAGTYLISSPLNMTSAQLNLVGDGMFQTVLVGGTGSGNPVIDMTGAVVSTVRDLSIETFVRSGTALANKSTYGVVWMRRSDLQSAEMNRLERVHINMHTDATANEGLGTIALYNCCGEVSSVRGSYLRADTAVVITLWNNTGFTSSYVQAQTPAQQSSMTVFEVDADTYLIGLAKPTVLIRGGANLRIEAHLTNQYAHNESYAGLPLPAAYPYAVEVIGQTHDLYLSGSVENCPHSLAAISCLIRGLRYHHYHGHGEGASNIWMHGAQIVSSVIQPVPHSQYQNTPGYLVDCAAGATSQIYTSEIFAYGNQGLNCQNTWTNSELSGCRIFTELPLADFAINFPTQKGNVVSAVDAVSVNGMGLRRGTTALRPAIAAAPAGSQYYDTTLGRPVWSDGTTWRDAAGAVA